MVDFDDLLRLCSHMLETDTRFAAAQRWRFQHLFVDEFQDVNPLQLRLLDAWRGSSYDLCVVGDPHQAIYGWNGADAGFLEDFRRLYPTADVVALGGNYRSTPQILEAAADVLRSAGIEDRTVRAARPDGVAVVWSAPDRPGRGRRHRPCRTRPPRPTASWSAQPCSCARMPRSADHRGVRASGIPYRGAGATPCWSGGGAHRPRPAAASARPLGHLPARHRRLAAEAAGGAGDERPDGERGTDAASDLALLVQLAHDHLRLDPGASALGLSPGWSPRCRPRGRRTARRRHDRPFHAAKGLEWPVVHLTGLEDGLVPIGHARTRPRRARRPAAVRGHDQGRGRAAGHVGGATPLRGKPADAADPWLKRLAESQRERPTEPTGPPPTGASAWPNNAPAREATPPCPPPHRLARLARRERPRRPVEPSALIDDRCSN